jgi:hypothetical protein
MEDCNGKIKGYSENNEKEANKNGKGKEAGKTE